MSVKTPVFVICVKAIIYLLLYNLHGCTFKCKYILTEYKYIFFEWQNSHKTKTFLIEYKYV